MPWAAERLRAAARRARLLLVRHRRAAIPPTRPATGTPEVGGLTSYEALAPRARAARAIDAAWAPTSWRSRRPTTGPAQITGAPRRQPPLRAALGHRAPPLGRRVRPRAMMRAWISHAPAPLAALLLASPRCSPSAARAGARPRRWRSIEHRRRRSPRSRCAWSRPRWSARRPSAPRRSVIQLDTPGGLERSMRSICQRLLNAEIPVIVYVAPTGGARGLRRGVHHDGRARGRDGARHQHRRRAPGGGRRRRVDKESMKKIENDAAAFARTIAVERGRNAEWAEKAVRSVGVDHRARGGQAQGRGPGGRQSCRTSWPRSTAATVKTASGPVTLPDEGRAGQDRSRSASATASST